MMPMAIQYCPLRKMPVRSQRSSSPTIPSTDSTAVTVYSRIATPQLAHPPEHRADGLVGEQAADRDDDEEHVLLEGHARRADAGGVLRAVPPEPAPDAEGVPGQEDDEHRQEREQQAPRAAVDPGAQNELERQRDEQAAAHEQEVLVAV